MLAITACPQSLRLALWPASGAVNAASMTGRSLALGVIIGTGTSTTSGLRTWKCCAIGATCRSIVERLAGLRTTRSVVHSLIFAACSILAASTS